MKKIFCAFVILTAMFAAMAAPAFAAEMKLAYVDMEEVFDGYQKTKDQDLVLKTAGEAKEKERNDMMASLRSMEDEIALLSADARAKKQEQLIEKKRQLEDFDRNVRQQLAEQRNKMIREIITEIEEAVQAVGQRGGYDMVFNRRMLNYQKKEYDITAQISAELAKKYKKA
ncbi:MAG: periplasmic chaperone [Candidatus Omnitrophica bacterium ADurb.Bin314]|jgi:Skp family chaperone for outer membrane proteins|nr:MAG: periplasmic chaperone [Candidatus Omnitrophica bacterium ADurb.Bin314]HPW64698.1 OmpH family outer membrane protein [Candidatus Omnitrophota bacterium]